jgi:hypothetical protein
MKDHFEKVANWIKENDVCGSAFAFIFEQGMIFGENLLANYYVVYILNNLDSDLPCFAAAH